MASKEKRNAKAKLLIKPRWKSGEKRKHDQKTARLRAAREAAGPPKRPSKKM